METVFCDLDGTLINSEQERINTYFLALNECNIQNYTKPSLAKLLGNGEKRNLSLIAPFLNNYEIDIVIKARKKHLDLINISKIEINHNVYSQIIKYKQIIIVTNSSYSYAYRMCNDLLKIPCKIIALEDNLPPKPDPYLYNVAFNKFADNKIKIVYEDSYSGINSAMKAGADVIYKVTNNEDIIIYKDFNKEKNTY